MNPRKVRLLLADDHAVLRSGLRLLLNHQPDFEVVGEASDGWDAIRLCRQQQPDILLLDLSMPELDGLAVLRHLQGEMPWLKVLVLTMHEDAEYLRRALAAGARGYVLKRAVDAELLSALRAVATGGTYVYPTLAAALLAPPQPAPAQPQGPAPTLSQRETEVLQLIALGHSHQEISEKLMLSVRTVETYKARLIEKLGVRSRAELVRYALAHHLVER